MKLLTNLVFLTLVIFSAPMHAMETGASAVAEAVDGKEMKRVDVVAAFNTAVDHDVDELTREFHTRLKIDSGNNLSVTTINILILQYLFNGQELRNKLIRLLLRCSSTQPSLRVLQRYTTKVSCFAIVDGTTIACASRAGVQVVNCDTGAIGWSIPSTDEGVVTAMHTINDQTLVCGCADGMVYTLDLKEARRYELGTCREYVKTIERFDDDRFVTGSFDGTLRVWNWKTRKCEQEVPTGEAIMSIVPGVGGVYVCFKTRDEFWPCNARGQFLPPQPVQVYREFSMGCANLCLIPDGIVGFDSDEKSPFKAGDCFSVTPDGCVVATPRDSRERTRTRRGSMYDECFGTFSMPRGHKATVVRDGCVAMVGEDEKSVGIYDIYPALAQAIRELNPSQRIFLLQVLLRGSLDLSSSERVVFATLSERVQEILKQCIEGEFTSRKTSRIRRIGSFSGSPSTTPPGSRSGSPTNSPQVATRRLGGSPVGSPGGSPLSGTRRLGGGARLSSRALSRAVSGDYTGVLPADE